MPTAAMMQSATYWTVVTRAVSDAVSVLAPDVPTSLFLLVGLSVLLAGTISGLTGFGFNLLSVPLLVVILPSHAGIVVSLATGMSVTTAMLLSSDVRSQIDRPTVSLLLGASLMGVPLGLLIFARATDEFLSGLVGAVTAVYALVVLTARTPETPASRAAGILAGAASGALASSTGLSGPPAVLFVHSRQLPVASFRATLIAYILPISAMSVTLLLLLRLASPHVLLLAVVLWPLALLGMAGGRLLFRWIPERGFQRIVLVFLLVMGGLNLINTLR